MPHSFRTKIFWTFGPRFSHRWQMFIYEQRLTCACGKSVNILAANINTISVRYNTPNSVTTSVLQPTTETYSQAPHTWEHMEGRASRGQPGGHNNGVWARSCAHRRFDTRVMQSAIRHGYHHHKGWSLNKWRFEHLCSCPNRSYWTTSTFHVIKE